MGDSSVTPRCAVQSKIPCILKTVVKPIPSSKRKDQNYSVEASSELSDAFTTHELDSALPTEKFDGTCCHVRTHNGQPMLWARLDRKPNKAAEKRFKNFQRKHREWLAEKRGDEPIFSWKFPGDLKSVSEYWIPADDIVLDAETKCPLPDANGHIPGWVPVEIGDRQYCWHASTVDYDASVALTLKPANHVDGGKSVGEMKKFNTLEISPTPLSELNGKTLELIGTNINGNPYELGSRLRPFHVLVEHGCILVQDLPQRLTYDGFHSWFNSGNYAAVEGIVWHFLDGKMFKLHRCHLSLPWPLTNKSAETRELPLLSRRPVTFSMKGLPREKYSTQQKSMFFTVNSLDDITFERFLNVFE